MGLGRRYKLVVTFLVGALVAVASPVSAAPGARPAAAAHPHVANVDFRGNWGTFQVVTENFATGDFTGTTSYGGDYALVNGHVSGNTYTFDITCCGGYISHNFGTITGDTLVGHFDDSYGHHVDYTASRAPTATVTVSISATVPPGGLGVGDTLTVPVTVSAPGTSSFTGLSLGTGLTVSGGSATVTKRPTGATGFSLAAGGSRTFTYEIKATKPGTVTLGVTVTGTAVGGGPVSASDSKTFPVATRALAIRIVTTPGKINLDVDAKGKVTSKVVTIKVTLTNTTKATITGISLITLHPVPADPTQALDQLAISKKLLPLKVSKLAAGKSAVKSFPLTVTGDGDYVVRAVALYDDPSKPGGNGRSFGQGGAFTSVVPLLWFRATQAGGAPTVTGGSPWYVTGEVRNLKPFQTICLPPLMPTFTGNAAGLGPRQIGLAEPAPPLAGPLAPGKYLLFQQRVDTSADGSTRGSLDFKPEATLGVDGDECRVVDTATQPRIAASKMVVAKGSTSFFAHVDNSNPGPANAGSLEFFGELSKGSAGVLARAYQGTLVLAHEYGSVAALQNGLKALSPANVQARAAQALAAMDKALETTADFWIYTTPAEKQAFLAQVADDVVAKTGQVWIGAATAIQKSAETWFDSVVNAYYSGDTTTMFKTLGGAAPNALATVAVETAKWEIGLALLKKAGALTGLSRRVTQATKTVTRLADMVAGRILNFEEMQRLWGLSKADVLAFDKIATEEGVLIGVRGRAPISVAKLEEGAVWKHENLKPKNVNAIDMKFLGFDAKDDGLVAFRSYTQKEKVAIIRKIQTSGLDAAGQQVAFARATTRFNEAKKYLPKIEGFAENKAIDVGFNYRENGLDLDTTAQVRKFALDSEHLADGTGTYYRPLQENPGLDSLASSGTLPKECFRRLAAVLCRVTGDMDGVYVTNVGGTALDEAKRARVYERLAAVGWQHPETLTWVKNDGSFYFGAKSKILKGLQKGGEAMVEFGADGIARATFLDLDKSWLFSADNYYLDVDGGLSAVR